MPKKIHQSPNGPTAMGPYSIATEANGFVFCSGMVPLVPETGAALDGDVATQTHQVMKNIGAVLGDIGLGYDDIVKTTIFLADIADFGAVNEVYAEPDAFAGLSLLVASYLFRFQFYCDFSGYTDIARGSARILGFDLMENFRRPYFARSVREFWRRWHISLTT